MLDGLVLIGTAWDLRQSGTDGLSGENCGLININDQLVIYAYGGAGGSGGLASLFDSGTGGGGYPAAGIGRRRCRPVGGGDHMDGAGGYSGGTNEGCRNNQSHNGVWLINDDTGTCGTSGGCYYSNNYKTKSTGTGYSRVPDVSFKFSVGGRRWYTVGTKVNFVGWIRLGMAV